MVEQQESTGSVEQQKSIGRSLFKFLRSATRQGPDLQHWHSQLLRSVDAIDEFDPLFWSAARVFWLRFFESHLYSLMLGLVVVIDISMVWRETNRRAAGLPETYWRHGQQSVLALYIMEIALRMYVWRLHYFMSISRILEFVVVAIDASWEIQHIFGNGSVFPSLSFFRVFRLMRLGKVGRVIKGLHEITLLLRGFYGAVRAICWSVLLLFLLLSIWSLLAVEILHPLAQELARSGVYDDCPRCGRAFASVMTSNLTFFQTILAGDSWGQLAVPMIEEYPYAAFILGGALLTVQLGALNLVLSVIVEKAVKSREEDAELQLTLKENQFGKAQRHLKNLCLAMDADRSGTLSLEEMIAAYDRSPDFAQTLRVMDVVQDDLETVFSVLDTDGSGEVDYNEFIEQLHKMKTQDSHTLLVFLRYHIKEIRENVRSQINMLESNLVRFEARQEKIYSAMSTSIGEEIDVDSTKALTDALSHKRGHAVTKTFELLGWDTSSALPEAQVVCNSFRDTDHKEWNSVCVASGAIKPTDSSNVRGASLPPTSTVDNKRQDNGSVQSSWKFSARSEEQLGDKPTCTARAPDTTLPPLVMAGVPPSPSPNRERPHHGRALCPPRALEPPPPPLSLEGALTFQDAETVPANGLQLRTAQHHN